jgi:hypothetical protein
MIQRYNIVEGLCVPDEAGDIVLYSDHSAMVNSLAGMVNGMRAYLEKLSKMVEVADE